MRIILTAVDQPLADAWRRFCGDIEEVTVHHGSIFDVPCDALVSPANSFGFMDGGIDLSKRWHREAPRKWARCREAPADGKNVSGTVSRSETRAERD